MGFYSTSMIIAGVILALFLGVIAYMLHTSTNTLAYPPVIAQCPDYWRKAVDDDDNEICENVIGVGINDSVGDVDCTSFPTTKFTEFTNNVERIQQQKAYAEKCNIAWDGVTNNARILTN